MADQGSYEVKRSPAKVNGSYIISDINFKSYSFALNTPFAADAVSNLAEFTGGTLLIDSDDNITADPVVTAAALESNDANDVTAAVAALE